MKRRKFLGKLATGATGIACGTLAIGEKTAMAKPKKRPNLVYIFADQLRHDVLGYAGDEKAITPNLDRLASQGTNFFNCTSVSPVCAAYRASLLTGKYTSTTGMVINECCVNPNHRAIGYVLHDAGYNMGYLGKWHLVDNHGRSIPQGPARLGFQHASLWRAYNFNHQNYAGYYWEDRGDEMVKVRIKGYQTDAWTDAGAGFIKDAAAKDEPFALFLSLSPPHDSWGKKNMPSGYHDKFADVDFPHPPNFKTDPDQYADRQKSRGQWDRWTRDLPGCRHGYYAMINHLDDKLAEITKALEDAGVADDTILVYTSDHGEMFGAQGRVYKLTFYEEAARVPFLVRWPGHVPAGARADACLNTPDIAPTLLGLLGLGVPDEMEGMDLSHVARGSPGPEPEFAFLQGMGHTFQWRNGSEWRAVRSKRYTYARYLRDGSEHLYDNQADRYQMKNLVDDPAHARELEALRSAMRRKMADLNDEFRKFTYYQSWMHPEDKYSVVASARGPFKGPWPRTQSIRGAPPKRKKKET